MISVVPGSEIKADDEVWIRARVEGFGSESTVVIVKERLGREVLVHVGFDDVRKGEPSDLSEYDRRIVEAAEKWREAYGKFDLDDPYLRGVSLDMRDAVDAKRKAFASKTRIEKIEEATRAAIDKYDNERGSSLWSRDKEAQVIAEAVEAALDD